MINTLEETTKTFKKAFGVVSPSETFKRETSDKMLKDLIVGIERGTMTINEARQKLELPPVSAAVPIDKKSNVYRLPFNCMNCGGNQYEINAFGRVSGGNVVLDKHLYTCIHCGTTYEKGAKDGIN